MPSVVTSTKGARLGPEDQQRKLQMLTDLNNRKLLTPSAERFIRSGRR